jgi:hypothetical protein
LDGSLVRLELITHGQNGKTDKKYTEIDEFFHDFGVEKNENG